MSITVGQQAPEFALKNQFGELITLSQYRGAKNVVVMFYPFAFTPTCTNELCAIRDDRSDFDNDDTVTLSVSCDPMYSLKVFAEAEGLTHHLLSDFWPHGEVSRAYGVFLDEKGFSTRGTFIIDKDGVVRWLVVNEPGQARSNDEYRAALAAL